MGRGGFNGGSTILGGGGRASGWSSFDPAEYRPEVRERPAKNGPQIIKNHTREVDVLDYLIDQKFRKVEQLKLNKNNVHVHNLTHIMFTDDSSEVSNQDFATPVPVYRVV